MRPNAIEGFNMKLAEALLLRADYRNTLAQLESRIVNNSKVQEDMIPDENPQTLLEEMSALYDETAQLVQRINLTNQSTMLNDKMSLTDAIVLRETTRQKHQSLMRIHAQASERDFRLTRTEIKMTTVIDIAELQKDIDALAKQIRVLDTAIQEKNWLTPLL